MYQVYFDGVPIYDPRDEELVIREPDVHLAVGEAGTMSFTIDATHPHLSRLTELRGVLELRADRLTIFRGRIIKGVQDFARSNEIEAEGLLACLNDSLVPPFSYPDDWLGAADYEAAAAGGNVVEFFLAWVLEQHNSQVGAQQQIRLGTVTVTDPNNYISRASSEYLTAADVVKKKLVDLLGGYLVADYSGAITVLHYYDQLPLTNTQRVEFGENLLDLVTETDATETYTAILPVGKDGLTIEDLPDGELTPGYIKQGRIIYREDSEELYAGRITRLVEWKDVTEAANLRTKALNLLATEGVKLKQTIEVTALDLGGSTKPATMDAAVAGVAVAGKAIVGASPGAGYITSFRVGRMVELWSRWHGFTASYPLMELEPNILNPGDTKITLGASALTSSGIAAGNQSATEDKLNQHRLELDKQAGSMETLGASVRSQITEAIQSSESIIFSALEDYVRTANYEEYQETVSSQLAIMADEILLKFTEAHTYTQNVDGDLQQTRETLSKYFEFGLDGLTIKAGEGAMQLTLDNDMIIFTKDGQQFGWWDGVDFHTGNIVIDVLERAQFGDFAFVPRSNGSLSLLKVGG